MMLNVSLANDSIVDSDYFVLLTDYDNFSVVWSCEKLNETASIEFIWFLLRSLNANITTSMLLQIAQLGVNISADDLRPTVQSEDR